MSTIDTRTPAALGYHMPAEWAPHDAIWLSWPHDATTFPDRVSIVEGVYVNIIEAIHRSEKVNLLIRSIREEQRILNLLEKNSASRIPPSEWNILFHVTDYADVWFRDYGPTFVVNQSERKLAMVHWQFNAWGGKYEELMKDTRIPAVINGGLKLTRFEPGIVMEGGSIEVNGAGTVMTTEQCLLNKNRNPSLSRGGIEAYLKGFLGVRHVLWLGEGIVGDDTDGHIDDIARFVNPMTVVCAYEDDPQDENFKLLEDNYRRLNGAVDQDGKSLTVIKLPMPGRVGDDEGRLPASYANFYIGNTVVLMPTFGHPNDAKAQEILQSCFPNRKVVGIPAQDLVYGLGTLHCISQQQPSI